MGEGGKEMDEMGALAFEPRLQLERQRSAAAAEAEESARRQEKQDGKKASRGKWYGGGRDKDGKKTKGKIKQRRTIFVNEEGAATDPKGYERNKVQTSKYTLLTFLPKVRCPRLLALPFAFRLTTVSYFRIWESSFGGSPTFTSSCWWCFKVCALDSTRCIHANLSKLKVFSIFGAAAPQVAMLPLVAILTITGVKDAVEDFRRHSLDNGVNNSAVTRLGDWKNVNQPIASRPWWDLFGLSGSAKVSKGVKKLREKEGHYDSTFLYEQQVEGGSTSVGLNESGLSLDQEQEILGSTHDYPPSRPSRPRSLTLESYANNSSFVSGRSNRSDVVSYNHPTPGTAKWERTLWKKLEVGDVVLLKENDQVPADIVVLSTSDPEGVCFVETKNLDGETNLKPRRALRATMGIANEEDIEHARFCIDAEEPNANLYSFNAVLKFRRNEESIGKEHPVLEGREMRSAEEKLEPVTINELLLRGCSLRNTKWVIGLVMFTGVRLVSHLSFRQSAMLMRCETFQGGYQDYAQPR